jgi:ABC-type glycerol-3-phosphate transport system permease component
MADMVLDPQTMMIIIIVVVCAIMFIGPIMWFINWFFKRRDRMIESPIDVHEMLMHKYKKAARRNLKAIKNTERPKRLHMLGDNDAPACDYAKMYGFIHSRDCVIIFFYNGNKLWLLSKVNWAWVPLELTRDAFGRNYCIKARGFKPKANYQIPVWTENISKEERVKLETIIDDAFCLAVEQEKYEEMYEQNVNSSIEAINAKRTVPQVYQRDDHLMRNSPEAKYASENTEQN